MYNLGIKAFFETFKLLNRLGIKNKDIIGVGGDVVKMGKSLFNTRINPTLIKFVEKNQKIPTKIMEEIKIHARTLKNVTESQKKLFEVNLKDLVNAKFPKPPVSSVKQPATSVKDAAEAFKGWKPTVIKGGKDGLATGGIAHHFRKKFDDGSDGTGVKLYPRASIIQGEETVGLNEDIDVKVRDVDYGITGLYEGDNWFAGAEIDKGNVKVDVTKEGDTLFKDTMGKEEVINFIAGFGDPNDEKFQIKVDDDFENVSIVLLKSFATGGIANHFRERVGFSRAGMVAASNPLFRGTTGPSQVLKAPRGYTGMQAILALENLPEANFLKKAEKDEAKKKSEEDPTILKRPDPKDPKEINKLIERIKIANEVRKLAEKEKKKKDREIFDERMHGEAGGKGTFTGSGTERKSIAPPGFTPKDKNILTLFRNNKNLEGLETKTINSLMEFRQNPELFYERVKDLKARGVDFDALYNPAEIAELLGLKTASGITDAIVSKNIPFEKIGAFKAVKLSDYLNSQIATIQKFKDVPLRGKEHAQRTDVMSEFRGLYSKFKDLRMDLMPKNVRKIYNKYNLSELEGGHANPLIFFSKKWKDGKLTNEREFDWIYRNKDKLLNKDNVVFQSKALNQKGGPFYDLIKDLRKQYEILSPLVDKYEGKGRVTNLKDKKLIEAANNKIMRIVYESELDVEKWLNKTGKYENRESKASDILSIARMKEGGLHGNLFNTDTGEVSLYTAAGEGAGTASGAADKDTLNVKLNTFSNYIGVLTNVIEDKKDKQILIEYFSDKVLPKFNTKFNKGGPVLSGVDNYILNRYK